MIEDEQFWGDKEAEGLVRGEFHFCRSHGDGTDEVVGTYETVGPKWRHIREPLVHADQSDEQELLGEFQELERDGDIEEPSVECNGYRSIKVFEAAGLL